VVSKIKNKFMVKNYKELIVWQKSVDLVHDIYQITRQMPTSERYILVSQMLRSAISIPSNIAEGWGRKRQAEFIRFLEISYASSTELETQIIIAEREYCKINYYTAKNILEEIQKMLISLINKVKQ
jgi:four helix bundle protein